MARNSNHSMSWSLILARKDRVLLYWNHDRYYITSRCNLVYLKNTLREKWNAIVPRVRVWIWSDGTIAHRISVRRIVKSSSSCTLGFIVNVVTKSRANDKDSVSSAKTRSAPSLRLSKDKTTVVCIYFSLVLHKTFWFAYTLNVLGSTVTHCLGSLQGSLPISW